MVIVGRGPWWEMLMVGVDAALFPIKSHGETGWGKPSNDNCDDLAHFIDLILGTSERGTPPETGQEH
jgi:hypothetical protein